jgi:FAD synthetase
LKEDPSERSRRYVEITSASLSRLKLRKPLTKLREQQVDYVLDMIRSYVKDAKHYAQNRKPVTSLACIAYAEGLLDALKYLEIADF